MKKIRFDLVILLIILLLTVSTKPAHAYLDPGSGSYIIQLIIAGGVGALFGVKTFLLQIKNFFANLFKKKKDNSSAPSLKKNNGK